MYIHYDPDEYETVVTSRPCTGCNGDRSKCHGQCNGSFGIGSKRRPPEAIAKIKADKQRQHEDEVLAEAEAIRHRRQSF